MDYGGIECGRLSYTHSTHTLTFHCRSIHQVESKRQLTILPEMFLVADLYPALSLGHVEAEVAGDDEVILV